ncbi:MAG TPA: hypothetical protein VIH60_08685 [Steroidobacteraceae bacterium]|jgi:hypothetical protein
MSSATVSCLAVVLCALPLSLTAQQSAPAATPSPSAASPIPRPDQLEPGVDTTAAAPAPAATAPAASASSASRPADSANPAAAHKDAAAPRTAAKKVGADRLELDTTDITGNRELPKVLYIVPWKHSDLGDLTGKPVNSLLDDVLQPIDRDVFQRQNRYYDALKPEAAPPKADAAQGSGNNP